MTKIPTFALVALFSLPAFSQSVVDGGFQKFMTNATGLGSQTITYGSNGQVLPAQGSGSVGRVGGVPHVDRAITWRNPAGNLVSGSARAAIPMSVVARSLLVAAAKSTPLLAAGYLLYDFATDNGFRLSKADDGSLKIEKSLTGCQPGMVCASWRFAMNLTTDSGWNPSPEGACAALASKYPVHSSGPVTVQSVTLRGASWPNAYSCNLQRTGTIIAVVYSTYQAGSNAQYWALSDADTFVNDIAPTIAANSDKIVNTINQVRGIVNLQPWQGPSTVTGPPTSVGPVEVSTVNGETTTKTTTFNHVYNAGAITTNAATTTVVTNNLGNVVSNSTTTTTNVPAPTAEPVAPVDPFKMPCGVSGTAPCSVKLDESGTPPLPPRPLGTAEDSLDAQKTAVGGAIDEAKVIQLPAWTWTFQLPTGCTPLPVFLDVILDPCEWQPMIHDLMSMIWAITGVFGLFAIFRMGVH